MAKLRLGSWRPTREPRQQDSRAPVQSAHTNGAASTTTGHPYLNLPEMAFWKTAVSNRSALQLRDMYSPRFEITTETRIATAGSCFAQHIGRQFKARGFGFVDAEPPPPMLDEAEHSRFGFGIYSGRYGNVYSARQLLQLFQRATGAFAPVDEYWEDGGRFYDPYRPSIEPEGYESLDELRRCRDAHLRAVAGILPNVDVFVFTFGLTEAWANKRDGAIYPTCPGTIHGTFDPRVHEFVNFTWPDVLGDFERFMALAREVNPTIRFLLTVSPVPLTATASGQHVLPATMSSKSTLRSVCGELYSRYDYVDYFPSYELVASHPMRAMHFDPNLRTVTPEGVAFVMDHFFTQAHPPAAAVPDEEKSAGPGVAADPSDAVCDEEVLERFA